MNYKLIAEISKSLLLARWRQTLVAAVGVTFGITMFISMLGFMNGLNDMLDGLILNRTAHIRLYNELKASKDQPASRHADLADHYQMIRSVKPNSGRSELMRSKEIIKTLNEDPRVLGFAPKLSAQIFYNVGAVDLTGVINGVDVQAENRLFFFSDYVTSGNYADLHHVPNSIILGKGAADKMLANIGDMVQVTTPKGERVQLKVVGYFQSGLADLDKVQSYASIATIQKLLGKPNSYVTDLQIKLKDINMAPAMAKEYAALFGADAEDIQTVNSQFETGTKVRTMISYTVGIVLLIVAGFGIYNILNMMIYEKMDTIAILKATGFSGKDVRNIFIGIAITIGFVGGMFGLLFGFFTSLAIDNAPFETAALPTIKTFPVNYNPKFYIIGIVFSLVTTYMAGYFPARKASKIDPVIIIRGK